MLKNIIIVDKSLKDFFVEIVILKRFKGVHLLFISKGLEFLFKINSIGKNPHLLSLKIDIHSNKNIFVKQWASKNFCSNNTVRNKFNLN